VIFLYQTFAHQVNRAKNMLDGLKANAEQLARWGVTPDFIAKMTDLHDKANQLESKRNALSASAQEATAELAQAVAELKIQYGIAKRLIRIEMPKESWPAFGFREGEYASRVPQETKETAEPAAS
jgi:hypothetical protein